MPEMHSGHHLRVSIQEFDELIAVPQRYEVVVDVTGLTADVRMQGEVPLGALDEMPRSREGQLQAAALIASSKTAGVIPVKVCGDDGVDLVGADAQPAQRMKQLFRFAQRDLARALLAELRADARLADDDAPVDTRHDADAGALDHVVFVGRLLFLPEDLGHDAEHQAAVSLPAT